MKAELQTCKAGWCGANACNTCVTIYTSMEGAEFAYACGRLTNSSLNALQELPIKQDECKNVPDELSKKIVDGAVQLLQSEKEEGVDWADKAIEKIKKSSFDKICTCSSDGCNKAVAITQTTKLPNNGSDRKLASLITIVLASMLIMKMFG